MVLSSSPEQEAGHSSTYRSPSSKWQTRSFLMSVSSHMAFWAKRAGVVSIKLKNTAIKSSHLNRHYNLHNEGDRTPKPSPKSPLVRPKQLLTQISNKAIKLVHSKKRVAEEDDVVLGGDEFGDGGVWQKTILMGDKCEPLDFSGVIYYDSSGKQLNEIPLRSPRASPLPGYLSRGK